MDCCELQPVLLIRYSSFREFVVEQRIDQIKKLDSQLRSIFEAEPRITLIDAP